MDGVLFMKTDPNFDTNALPFELRGCILSWGVQIGFRGHFANFRG